MSSIPVTELSDHECEKGMLTQRPPIPYATPKAEATMKASRETVKVKTPEGGPEEYLQHHNTFL